MLLLPETSMSSLCPVYGLVYACVSLSIYPAIHVLFSKSIDLSMYDYLDVISTEDAEVGFGSMGFLCDPLAGHLAGLRRLQKV